MTEKQAKTIHQGQLLEELRLSKKIGQEAFVAKLDRSRTWFQENIKEKKLSAKTIRLVCDTFKVPKEYFEGKVAIEDLPMIANEDEVMYRTKYQELEAKFNKQSQELLDAYRKIHELQESLLQRLKENA